MLQRLMASQSAWNTGVKLDKFSYRMNQDYDKRLKIKNTLVI